MTLPSLHLLDALRKTDRREQKASQPDEERETTPIAATAPLWDYATDGMQ